MQELLQRITNQITEFWGRLSNRNRIQIISAVAAGIVALVVLGILLSRPQLVQVKSDINPEDMGEIQTALSEAQIDFRMDNDATTLYVDEKKQDQATIILADLGLVSDAQMTWEEALTNTISTSQSEKEIKAQLAFEEELNMRIEALNSVRQAWVKLYIGETDLAVFEEDKESSASVTIEQASALSDKTVQGIVGMLRTSVPNLDPVNISIMNTDGEVLYDGYDAEGMAGNVSSQIEHVEQLKKIMRNDMTQQLLSTGLYDDVSMTFSLDVDFDSVQSVETDFEQGPVSEEYTSQSEGSSTDSGGVPGTDSNTNITSYPQEDTSSSSSVSSTTETVYNNDQKITNIIKSIGDVNYDESRVSVSLNKLIYIYEEDVEADGLLADMTWREYVEANDVPVELTVSDSIIDMIRTGTGIDDISVVSYQRPIFVAKEVTELDLLSYLPIALIVVLVGLLVFAVIRSTEPMDVEELEPELSVEEMLESTKAQQELEAIEFDDKSDIRKQLEKFVDANPEAVAALLRNWINEEWE